MKWPWLVALVLPGGLILGRLIYRRCQRDHVSPRWLEETYRRGLYNTYDGVAWKFPINKQRDQAGWWNRHTLRKRA